MGRGCDDDFFVIVQPRLTFRRMDKDQLLLPLRRADELDIETAAVGGLAVAAAEMRVTPRQIEPVGESKRA